MPSGWDRLEFAHAVTDSISPEPVRRPFPLVGVLVALGLLGLMVRLRELTVNRSLWLDESFLALNLLDRDFLGLLRPLDHLQTAPLLFLWATELTTRIFGFEEWAMRLPAFISGVAALVFISVLAWRMLREQMAILAVVALGVVSPQLVFYSAEIKPYSTDVLGGAVLTWLALRIHESFNTPPFTRRLITFAVVATVLVFTTTPSVFVIAGVCTVLGIEAAVRRNWKAFANIAAVSAITAGAFGIHFALVLTHATKEEQFYSRWGQHFPGAANSVGYVEWALDILIRFITEGLWFRIYWPVIAFMAIGVVWLAMRRPWMLAILIAPVFVTFGVSMAGQYPLGPRVMMFVAPAALILIGGGVEAIIAGVRQLWKQRWVGPCVGGVAAVVVLVQPTLTTAHRFWQPVGHEELRPLLEQVAAERTQGEAIWFSGRALQPYSYYSAVRPELEFDEKAGPVFLSERRAIEGSDIAEQVNEMFPDLGVWIVFSHFRPHSSDPEQAAAMLSMDRELKLSRPLDGAHLLRFGPKRSGSATTVPD